MNFNSFSDYGKPNLLVDEIAKELGYKFQSQIFDFKTPAKVDEKFWQDVENLENDRLEVLKTTIIDSEFAKREILIAPVITLLIRWFHYKLRIEYPINVAPDLKGKIDYLLYGNQDIVVVEAKNDNFDIGANQLVPEMIAVGVKEDRDIVYGAVTNGRLWQFYCCDRLSNSITQDVRTYSFLQNSSELFSVLLSILSS